MKTLIINKLPRIIKNKRILERRLNIKITNRGKEVTLTGTPESEFLAEKVIDALDFGFPLSHALSILDEEFVFEIINIKSHTKRKDLKRVRARIIGTQGKTLSTLTNLTNCYIEIKDNEVGIICPAETIKATQEGIISIIKGSKQSNVYSYIERNQPAPISDLGLRNKETQ